MSLSPPPFFFLAGCTASFVFPFSMPWGFFCRSIVGYDNGLGDYNLILFWFMWGMNLGHQVGHSVHVHLSGSFEYNGVSAWLCVGPLFLCLDHQCEIVHFHFRPTTCRFILILIIFFTHLVSLWCTIVPLSHLELDFPCAQWCIGHLHWVFTSSSFEFDKWSSPSNFSLSL